MDSNWTLDNQLFDWNYIGDWVGHLKWANGNVWENGVRHNWKRDIEVEGLWPETSVEELKLVLQQRLELEGVAQINFGEDSLEKLEGKTLGEKGVVYPPTSPLWPSAGLR